MAEEVAGVSAELGLTVEGFLNALDKAAKAGQQFEKKIQSEFDKITGVKATQQAELIAKGLERAGGSAKLTAGQIDILRGRIEALTKAGARLPSSLAALTKLPSSLGATLGTNIQTQALGSLQGQLGPLGGLLSGISGGALAAAAGVGALAVGAGAAASAIASAAKEFGDFSSNLQNLSAQTGIGTTALQELSFAGSFVDVSLDEIASSVGRMQKAIAEGDSVFQRLGLNLEHLQTLKPEEQFFEVAAAINAIQDPARRTAAAIEVFGKSGASLLPLFGNLEKLKEEAHRLGVVFSEDAVRSGGQLDDAFNRLGRSADALKLSIGALAANTGFISFLETLAAGIGEVASKLPQFIDLLNRLGPILSTLPGGSAIAGLAGIAQAVAGAGGSTSGADPAAAAALAKQTISGTQFQTQAEEAKQKKADEERKRSAEAAAKAAQAAADKAAKAWADGAEKARVEWDKFFESVEEAGDTAVSDMLKMASEDAKKSADAATQAMLAQIAAVVELGESFGEVNTEAKELLSTFNLLKTLQGGLGDQTTEGLQQMGETFGALDQQIPGVADALAEVNAELAKRGERPIISESELARIAKARAELEKLANTLGNVGGILSEVGGLFEALGGSADSGLGKAISGLSGVANAAAGVASNLASGNILGAIGAGISGVTSLIKGIGGLFKTPEWKKTATEAGKIFGDELGGSISKELAEAIGETAKALDISKASASLLHIGDVMDEAGGSATGFADEMSTLLQGIADGSVPASEGIEALGDAFSRLADEAEAGSVSAMASMGALAAQARALGQSIPEIDAAVASAVQESVGALGGLGGIKLIDEADAKSQAQIFLNVFNGVLATEGIVAAAQAIKPALDTFREQLTEAGIGKAAADTILGPINSAMSLLKNDMTKGGAEGAQALKTILESQLKAGFLDVNTFGAIQQQAGSAFDQMVKGGADVQAALQAVAPLLAQIQQTAAATGQAIDPVSQKLIDQAKAAGIAFPTDTGQQMVDLLKELVTVMGGSLPASVQAAASSMTTLGSTTSAAAAQASSSLTGIGATAAQTSSTILGAFSGVGDQITSAIAPAGDQIEQQLASAFDAATGQAQQFASFLQKLDNTTLTIPFTLQPTGGFAIGGGEFDISGIPKLKGGGDAHGPRSGYLAVLHGDERVTPLDESGRGTTNSTVNVTINGSGLNETQLEGVVVRSMKRAFRDNRDGVNTAASRALGGKR